MSTTQPCCVQDSPCEVALEEGKSYFWCTCGLSKKRPFCDGAHKGTGFKSQCFTAETSEKIWLCTCRKTKNPPFCDGSHKTLIGQNDL